MNPPPLSTLDYDFTVDAAATVDASVRRRVAHLAAHPCAAIRLLGAYGLDMLEPAAIAARAEAMGDQARSLRRGWMDFGREFDLRVIHAYALHMMKELEPA